MPDITKRASLLDRELDGAFARTGAISAIGASGPREWPRASLYALAFTASELVSAGALAPRDAAEAVMGMWMAGVRRG